MNRCLRRRTPTQPRPRPRPRHRPLPEPEPWTPERVNEWNAYYDRYVMGAALLLALVVACNYVTDSRLFLHLRAGQLIGERKAPLTTDEFSYTQEDQTWVDVPWLFQWTHAALYDLVYSNVPVDPTGPDGQPRQGRPVGHRCTRSCSMPWCGWRRPGCS